MGVEVGCPPVSTAAAVAGRAPAALVQVGLLTDELALAATSHVIPLSRCGHRDTVLLLQKSLASHFIQYENHDSAIAMSSSSCADTDSVLAGGI